MARRPLRLTTQRLTVRPLQRQDVTPLTRYRNDPEVAGYQEWALPYTRDAAHQLVDDSEAAGGPVAGDWVQLGIALDDQLIGDLAVWLDDTADLAVIGYTLAPEHQRHGYATEAVSALVDWLFGVRHVHRVSATLDPANLASAGVLERCGFRYVGTAHSAALIRGEWVDDARFELVEHDWRRRKKLRKPVKRVDLAPITRANLRQVGNLDRGFSQRRFVASVYQSYGDALIVPSNAGEPVKPWLRAIVADDQLAGFAMVAEPGVAQQHPYLWRFLIDWEFQRRSVGAKAIARIAEHWEHVGATHLTLSCVAGVPGSPEGFYRRLGFVPTGRVESGETEMIAPIATLLSR